MLIEVIWTSLLIKFELFLVTIDLPSCKHNIKLKYIKSPFKSSVEMSHVICESLNPSYLIPIWYLI